MNIVVFYDRSIRLWAAYTVDERGFQNSETEYAPSKQLALKFISMQKSC